jgi:hypothetical protein
MSPASCDTKNSTTLKVHPTSTFEHSHEHDEAGSSATPKGHNVTQASTA